jgi:hypothetical protein
MSTSVNGGDSPFPSSHLKTISLGATHAATNHSSTSTLNKSETIPKQQITPKISTKEENLAKLKNMTSDFWAQM